MRETVTDGRANLLVAISNQQQTTLNTPPRNGLPVQKSQSRPGQGKVGDSAVSLEPWMTNQAFRSISSTLRPQRTHMAHGGKRHVGPATKSCFELRPHKRCGDRVAVMSLVSTVKIRQPSPNLQTEGNAQQKPHYLREDGGLKHWAAIMRPICRKLTDVSTCRLQAYGRVPF